MEEPTERSTKKPKLPKQKVADASKSRRQKHSLNDEVPATTKNEKTESSKTAETSQFSIWSRDEDKIVLEQIKMGFTNEENLVLTLHREDKLPNRSYSEIFERLKFLMDVIANL